MRRPPGEPVPDRPHRPKVGHGFDLSSLPWLDRDSSDRPASVCGHDEDRDDRVEGRVIQSVIVAKLEDEEVQTVFLPGVGRLNAGDASTDHSVLA